MQNDKTELVSVKPDEFRFTPGDQAGGGEPHYNVFGTDQNGVETSIRMTLDQGQRFLEKHCLTDRMPKYGHEQDPVAIADGQGGMKTVVKMKPVLTNPDTARSPADMLKDVGNVIGYVEPTGRGGNSGFKSTRLIGDLSTEATHDANAALSTKDGHLHVRDMQQSLADQQHAGRKAQAEVMQPKYDEMLAQLREGGLSGIRSSSTGPGSAANDGRDLVGEAIGNLHRNRSKGPDDLAPPTPRRRPSLTR